MPTLPANPPEFTKKPENLRYQLQEIPAFRALLRAVETDFYHALPLQHPVLDVGCGDAHFAAATFDEKLDVGLDPWWIPLHHAGERKQHRLLNNADGARMPYPSDSFPTVISNSVLEHIPDVDPVLAEVGRVMQPGGVFYFCVPGPNFRRFLSVAHFLDRLGMKRLAEAYRGLFDKISRHQYYNTPEEWEARLAQAGLELERWWTYFSPKALAALEWGHSLGLPSVVARWLTGRWLIAPTPWNVSLTYALLHPYYEEPLPNEGAYLFFVARKPQ